ncbi:MAG: trigger factor [Bacilli bacterium]|nr:trigger factor [Bacilli bacterium]
MSTKIANYRGRQIGKAEIPQTTEEELNSALSNILQQATTVVAKEGAAANGDIANIDFEGFIDGVPFQGGRGEHYDLELGSGSFIPGFEEQLVGHSAGEDVDVNVSFPENYHAVELKGKPAVFKCHIHEVKTKKPAELTDEFAKANGAASVDDFKRRVSEEIKNQKIKRAGNEYLDKLLAEIISESEIEADPTLVETYKNYSINVYSRQIASMGMTLDQYFEATGTNKETFMANVAKDAEFSAKVQVVLDVVAIENNIIVSEEELNKNLQLVKNYYHLSDEQFEKFCEAKKDEVRRDILKGMCAGYLIENNN